MAQAYTASAIMEYDHQGSRRRLSHRPGSTATTTAMATETPCTTRNGRVMGRPTSSHRNWIMVAGTR
jgi:hypothetical protein